MKEMVKRKEVFDVVNIEEITTLEQADKILEECDNQDANVLDVFVHNAITRGAVYHKLTEVGNGGLGLLNEEVGDRYEVSNQVVGRYINVFNNRVIFLRKISGLFPNEEIELKPTLSSLLDAIAKDPDNVTKRIESNIESRGVSTDITRVISSYMETAKDDIRYLFSKKQRVSLGRLATAIKEEDEDKIVHIIELNGYTEDYHKREFTAEKCFEKLKERDKKISRLEEENDLLRKRNKFLLDSNNLSTVRELLRRANRNKEGMRKLKPEIINALNIMGVDVSVSESELKKAYREKVGTAHPDMGGTNEEFRMIAEANKLIKNFLKGL